MTRQPDVHQSEKGHYGFLHEVGICAMTGKHASEYNPLEVAHLRAAEFDMNKEITGAALKPHYRWTLPLLATEHHEQERIGLIEYFHRQMWPYQDCVYGPLVCASVLFAFSTVGDVEGARRYLAHNHRNRWALQLAQRNPWPVQKPADRHGRYDPDTEASR